MLVLWWLGFGAKGKFTETRKHGSEGQQLKYLIMFICDKLYSHNCTFDSEEVRSNISSFIRSKNARYTYSWIKRARVCVCFIPGPETGTSDLIVSKSFKFRRLVVLSFSPNSLKSRRSCPWRWASWWPETRWCRRRGRSKGGRDESGRRRPTAERECWSWPSGLRSRA